MSARRARPSAISTIGLTGAPATASTISGSAAPPEHAGQSMAPAVSDQDVSTSRRHDATTAGETVAYTLRLTPAESLDLDDLVLQLRRAAGGRRLDKSTLIKALINLTSSNPGVRDALISQLRG